jgi:hypothetical protein
VGRHVERARDFEPAPPEKARLAIARRSDNATRQHAACFVGHTSAWKCWLKAAVGLISEGFSLVKECSLQSVDERLDQVVMVGAAADSAEMSRVTAAQAVDRRDIVEVPSKIWPKREASLGLEARAERVFDPESCWA